MQVTAANSAAMLDLNSSPRLGERVRAEESRRQGADDPRLREVFDEFVGEAFFSTMLKSMRSTLGKTPYFHGGRAEEMFTQQLDQTLTKEMTKASAHQIADPMYDLFALSRK
ncbi:MAG: rod-binding protein [Pirellulales bacterium]|nr:rod-binding protein [Pirellulales bacterium]